MATHMGFLSSLLYLEYGKQEIIYTMKLQAFIKNGGENEYEFLKELLDELNNNRTVKLEKDIIIEEIKRKKFTRVPFDNKNETHLSYLEMLLRQRQDKQYEQIWREENLLSFLKIKLDRLPKSKEAKKNLYEGKPFNISERYKILNELTGIDLKIEQMGNTTSGERDMLLANILGCDQQVARGLRNGTQQKRTRVDEKRVAEYLKTFQ